MKKLEDYVLTIPDFPQPGVMFRDVTSVLADPDGLRLAVDEMTALLKDVDYDVIVGLESRGFCFGMPIAYKEHKPFIMARKAGKLPRETAAITYDLEYGSATMEIHKEDIRPGQKIVIVDDLIATGGTVEAAAHLVESMGAEVVKMVFLMELAGFESRERLKQYDIASALVYDGK